MILSGVRDPMNHNTTGTLRTALLALLPLLCVGCSQPGELLGRAADDPPLPKHITLAFNHRDGSRYRSPIDGQWRNGDNLEQMVIDAINAEPEYSDDVEAKFKAALDDFVANNTW